MKAKKNPQSHAGTRGKSSGHVLLDRLNHALALSATSTAYAKQEYATYEGLDAIQQGRGGTKITKNGIDYWTNGTPPRRFQVLGFLTDARKNRLVDGNVVGSKSVAEKTLRVGGSAPSPR